jgi:multidrug efflux pump subunit AcrA (membrane-fusion protein)
MRAKKTRAITILAALLLLGGALGLSAVACRRGGGSPGTAAGQVLYHCPMHPTYVSDQPGKCPICKMDLVPIEPAPGGAGTGAAHGAAPAGSPQRRILYYRSPMDPSVHSDVPRKDDMGMDFVPVYEDQATTPVVAGRAMVALSPERRQILGVRSEPVTRRHLDRTLRTVGRVAIDERRLHHIHTKYEAYVEKLYVNFTGQMVKQGDHLAALYSPELVATQQEYLLAYRAQGRLGQSGIDSVARGGADLLEAARQRLLFWDVSPEDIAALERTGQVQRTVDLHADLPGYVLQKSAIHGMRVTPADTLFDIADLSAVWILADVYESDLSTVQVGMGAEVTMTYEPGRTWRGTITYINPLVEPGTRTIKVRVEVANGDYALKPDMFADVVLHRELGDALFVPESAVLKPGDRQIVFVDLGDGRLQPREIQTGVRVEGGYAVLSGLAEGEKVVTSANFLIDSESSLNAAVSSMGGTPAAAGPHAGHAGPTPSAPAPAPRPTPAAGPAPRAPAPPASAAKTVYTCPMHPQVRSDEPGTCPICGMALVPAKAPAPKPAEHRND